MTIFYVIRKTLSLRALRQAQDKLREANYVQITDKTNFKMFRTLYIILLCIIPLTCLAGDNASVSINLKMDVPETWQEELEAPPNNLPPTIILTPDSKEPSKIMITVLKTPEEDENYNSSEHILDLVKKSGLELLPRSLETEVEVYELKGKSSIGYYYTLTDKAPRPEEYTYATQGGIGVGDLLLMFTILTNEGGNEVVEEALKMLEDAQEQIEEDKIGE